MTTGSSNRTLLLPASSSSTGRTVTVAKVDSGTGHVLVDGNSGETINGASKFYLTDQYESVTVVCDGSNWQVVGSRLLGRYEAACSSSVTAAANDNYDIVTGCTFTLPPGTWKVGYSCSGRATTTTTNASITTLAILAGGTTLGANTTTGIIDNTTRSVEYTSNSTTSTAFAINASAEAIVTITSDTVYSLMYRVITTTDVATIIRTTNFNGSLTDPDGGTVLWAQRVA